MAKSPYYSLLNFTNKNFFKIWSFGQNSNKLSKIRSIRLYTLRIAQNSHRLLIYLYYVSGTCPGREPCRIPANYANSAQFAHKVRELREIRTFCLLILHYVSGTCTGRELSRIPANYANSTQFAHTVRELHEIRTNC